MATLDYVDIPPGATRLRSSRSATPTDIRPAPAVFTSLPNPDTSSSSNNGFNPGHRARMSSLSLGAGVGGLASPTLGFIPQLLLSSSFPGLNTDSSHDDSNGSSAGGDPVVSNPRQKLDPEKYTLLSTKDPLSLPIMTNNFKRFVSKIGPVFWLQDRIEEIVLWKRGWKVTLTWMALYAFLCYFPKFVLLLPHAAIIGIILSTYPYPPSGSPFSLNTSAPSSSDPNGQDTAHLHAPATAPEGSIPWQANIQGIQNLMGAVSDLFTAAEPYVYHFVLTPAHLREPLSSRASRSTTSTASGGQSSSHSVPPTHSPYTPHILILLTVTFPLLAFLVSLPTFPTRLVFLLGGLAPFVATNPLVQRAVSRLRSNPLVGVALRKFVLEKVVPTIRTAYSLAQERTRWLVSFLGLFLGRGLGKRLSSPPKQIKDAGSLFGPGTGTTGPGTGSTNEKDKLSLLLKQPLSTVVQRIIDNDRLTDKCWNSEMWEVELWENERFGGTPSSSSSDPLSPPHSASSFISSSPPSTALVNGKWSKANLRPNERSAWTRGRDGGNGGGTGVEVSGEVSNLTFSLAPGWSFVETEDWRKDVVGEWSGVGCDEDGWVYTNDAWLGARPAPYTAGGGSVTRRRRWTRRVWFDVELAKLEEEGNGKSAK